MAVGVGLRGGGSKIEPDRRVARLAAARRYRKQQRVEPDRRESRWLGQSEGRHRCRCGLVALTVDADLSLHGARAAAVEDLDAVEEGRFQIRSERVRDPVQHVRFQQRALQPPVLVDVASETDRARRDHVPAGHATLVVGARVVREVLAAVKEFQQAGACRLHPRVRCILWIGGHRHNAVHEARHVRLETDVW
jgi:hypothetical protein